MQWLAIILGLLSALIWGVHSSVSLLAINEGWTSLDLAATRVAGGMILCVIWLSWRQLRSRQTVCQKSADGETSDTIGWRKILALTCFAGLPFSLINIGGLQFAPITHAAAISLGFAPVIAAFLGKPILGQAISRDHWLALLFITFGVSCIWLGTSLSWRYALGDLCFFIGATLWAMYAIYLRHWNVKPEQAAMYTTLGSSPYLLWYYFAGAWPDTGSYMLISQLVFQGMIVGVLAIFFYGKTVSILGPQLGTLFSALPPVVVPIVANVLLGYQSDAYEYLGIALVFSGMILAFSKPLQRKENRKQSA